MSAFEDDVGIKARPIAGRDRGFTKTVAIAEEEKWIWAKVSELKSWAAGEFVFFGKSREQALGENRKRIEFVAADGQREDGDIYGAGAEAVEKDRSDFFGDREMDFGKFAGEAGQARRQPVRRDSRNSSDDDGARFGLQALGDFVLGGGELVEDGAGAREKRLAEVGEANGAAQAIKQAAAEFGFELEYLLGEGRLRNVATLGSAGEGARVRDRTEVAKLVEFHGRAVSRKP